MLGQLTNLNVDGKMVQTYEFINKEGKQMIVHGSTALAVSSLSTADMLGKKAGILKAIALHKFYKLNSDELKEKYNVKNGKAFCLKFVATDISGDTFDKDILAVEHFLEINNDGSYSYKIPQTEGLSIGKLIKLNAYFADANRRYKDDDELATADATANIIHDFDTGILTHYMTDSVFEKAIKKSLTETIETDVKEVEPTAEPTAEPTSEPTETNEPTKKFVTSESNIYSSVVKVQLAMEELNKFMKSKEFDKLSDKAKGIINLSNETMLFVNKMLS